MPNKHAADDSILFELAANVGEALKAQGLMLATAESCTGGWIAQALTAVPGSSSWFERGFVTYTYISKREMLGVSQETLGTHGAVSEQTVREMVIGALANSHAQVAVSVSGTAGPTGGTPDKPLGLVWVAIASANGVKSQELRFRFTRKRNIELTAAHTLRLLHAAIVENK
jgi:nicotinamide-nucleotide amidase